MNLSEFVSKLVRVLNEDTTSANISYIPGGFTTVRNAIAALSKVKKEWGIKILDQGDLYEVAFENSLKIGINKEDYAEFNQNVLQIEGLNKIDLSQMLNEEVGTFTVNSINDVKTALTDTLIKVPQVQVILRSVNAWRQEFPGTTAEQYAKCAISSLNYRRDSDKIIKQMKESGEIGNMQLLVDAIENTTSLNMVPTLAQYEYIVGDILKSTYEGIELTLHTFVNLSFRVTQFIIVDDDELLNELGYYSRVVRIAGTVVYPIQGIFNNGFFGNIRDTIDSLPPEVKKEEKKK